MHCNLFHRALAVCGAVLLLIVSTRFSHGQVVFSENFESYDNHAAFAAVWSQNGSPPHTLDTAFGQASAKSLRLRSQTDGGGVTNRWYRNLSTSITPTDAQPLEFSFDFYLDPAGAASSWLNDWQLIDIRAYSGGEFGSGALTGLVAMGVSRATGGDADFHDDIYFQGRIVAPGHTAQTYYSLDQFSSSVPRSSGWHRMSAQIEATSTLFSVDGQPAELVNVGISSAINSIILGSDLPSRRDYWIDNIELRNAGKITSVFV